MVGELNNCLDQPQDQHEEYLETSIANYELADQTLHFIPRRRYRGKGCWSWRMWRDRRPITDREDYIIVMDRRDFYNFCIKGPRGSTFHQMILSELKRDRVRINHNYCKGSTIWPIVAPNGFPIPEEDSILNELRKEINKPMRT